VGKDVTVTYGLSPDQLKQAIEAATAGAAGLTSTIVDLSRRLGVTEDALRTLLRTLGEQDVPPEQLETKLAEITTRYREMQERLAALEQDSTTSNLTRQAAESLNAGRFADADRLLEQAVQTSSGSRAAKLLSDRADIALVQLQYKRAADLLSTAASVAPAPERANYSKRQASALYSQGDEGGDNEALRTSIEMQKRALQELTRDRTPLEWAAAQNGLGNALAALGGRETGTVHLEEAIRAYRAALEERSRERLPLYWAQTQSDLGDALAALGEREGRTAHVEEAIAAYRAALLEQTQDRTP
jgi:tetratricopeptide (TPR) repeat protein